MTSARRSSAYTRRGYTRDGGRAPRVCRPCPGCDLDATVFVARVGPNTACYRCHARSCGEWHIGPMPEPVNLLGRNE